MKVDVVVCDEIEKGDCVLFNLGYIFGYVIEVCMGYGNWLYGEGVVVGMLEVVEFFCILGNIFEFDVVCFEKLIVCVVLLMMLLDGM